MKFRPEITRVKLNPEQAVLSCGCYDVGEDNYLAASLFRNAIATVCKRNTKEYVTLSGDFCAAAAEDSDGVNYAIGFGRLDGSNSSS